MPAEGQVCLGLLSTSVCLSVCLRRKLREARLCTELALGSSQLGHHLLLLVVPTPCPCPCPQSLEVVWVRPSLGL